MAGFPDTVAQLKIRVPVTLKKRLSARAVENGRSLNSEIVMILAKTVRDAKAGA